MTSKVNNTVSFAYARRRKCTKLDPTARYVEINGEYIPESPWMVGTTVWRLPEIRSKLPNSGPYTIIETERMRYRDCVVIEGFGLEHTINVYWLSKTPT